MWNTSDRSSGCRLAKMTCELAFLLSLMGPLSAHPLAEEPLRPLICPGPKCPRGFSSVCQPLEAPSCIPCGNGTYLPYASRKKVCRPCSRCRDNEFEARPCTRTSNVVCQKCSECSPGFEVVQSCEKTRDTICRPNCRLLEAKEAAIFGLVCDEKYVTGEHSRRRDGKQDSKDAMPVSKVEQPPCRNNTGESQEPETPTLRAGPAPLSLLSASPHSTIALRTVPNNSVDVPFRSVISPTRSALATSKSSAESAPASDVRRRQREHVTHSAQKKYPRRRTQPNKTENAVFASLKPTFSYTKRITSDVLVTPAYDTDRVKPNTVNEGVHPTMAQRGRDTVYIIIIPAAAGFLGVAALASLLIFKAKKKRATRTQQVAGRFFGCRAEAGNRYSRGLGSSDCCHGSFVSSTEAASPEQMTVAHLTETDLDFLPNSAQVTVISYPTSEVKPSVLDVFPPDASVCSCAQFVTRVEGTFSNDGGTLSHLDSNVSINIEHGTFPDGNSQPIFFHVIHDETLVIRDIPETDERTLISPVIHCGPDDINPSKAIEIVLPHCLYVDEVKKGCITVYRCGQFSDSAPMIWEKIPSASEKNCHSKAWFTVKKDSVYIKTKTFSIWCVFACGGPKRKRATVFARKPNPNSNLISLRFYIYSDNEDSKRRVERIENEKFPGSKAATMEKPFKVFNDNQDIAVWLDSESLHKNGWEPDQTPLSQSYDYQMAYRNGFRSCNACQFSVKPIKACLASAEVEDFSCNVFFQQEEHQKHFLYVNPGIPLLPSQQCTGSYMTNNICEEHSHAVPETDPFPDSLVTEISEVSPQRLDKPVTREDCLCICSHIGPNWKQVLRRLGMEETVIENLDHDTKGEKVGEKCFQGLFAWTKSAGRKEATIRKLCNALRKVRCSEALEMLLKNDVGESLNPIPESTWGLGRSTSV